MGEFRGSTVLTVENNELIYAKTGLVFRHCPFYFYFIFLESGSHFAQDGIKHSMVLKVTLILLRPLPKYLDYRHEPPHAALDTVF